LRDLERTVVREARRDGAGKNTLLTAPWRMCAPGRTRCDATRTTGRLAASLSATMKMSTA
jgi:hypothetical protein